MNNNRSFLNFDFIIFFAVLSVITVGICFIYSSGINSDGVNTSNEYLKQTLWAVTGLIIMMVFIFIDYKMLYDFSAYIYGISILLLLITLFLGNKVNGARSWLGFMGFGIQPSEFAKIGTIAAFSAYCAKNRENIKDMKVFLKGLVIPFIPMLLILAQPDLGTALVYVPIFFGIYFFAGAKIRYLFFLAATGFLSIVFTIIPVWNSYITKHETLISGILNNQTVILYIAGAAVLITLLSAAGWIFFRKGYYYWMCYSFVILTGSLIFSLLIRKVLKVYQIMRLAVFLDPSIDPHGAGWNIIQSLTAIGSGGILGKGFLRGTQSHYHYLPEQSNDFIFSIIAEESGFLGCMFIFFCFFLILLRGLIIICASKDSFGSYLATGITAMIFFHFMVNIGMAMGIMPVMGIPLLYLSYGGSSLWTSMAAAGILINIYYRRYRFKI